MEQIRLTLSGLGLYPTNYSFLKDVLVLVLTFYMTSKKIWLEDYRDVDGEEVVMVSNAACRVKGIGNVNLKFEIGYNFTLETVKYVIDLKIET